MAKRKEPPPPPPADLDEGGSALWEQLVSEAKQELTSSDLMILRSLIAVQRRLDAVCAELEQAAVLSVEGSTGQPRAHPLLQTERELRAELWIVLEAWRMRSGKARY